MDWLDDGEGGEPDPPPRVWTWAKRIVPERIFALNATSRYPYAITRASLYLVYRRRGHGRRETALGLTYSPRYGRSAVDDWIRDEYRNAFPRPSLETARKRIRDCIVAELIAGAPNKIIVTGAASSSSFIASWDTSHEIVIFPVTRRETT